MEVADIEEEEEEEEEDEVIECEQTLSGTVGHHPDSVSLRFVNDEVQSVTFTNCDSDFDTTMFLGDSSGALIQYNSDNQCDGDDCSDDDYCSTSMRETFTMSDLQIGAYILTLTPYSQGGSWSVTVHCSNETRPPMEVIECGQTLTGSLGNYESVSLHFENDIVEDVTFTNCDSDFDTTMFLTNSSGDVIQQNSDNQCTGDDCYDYNYCSTDYRETFTMSDLEVGSYTLSLTPYGLGGEWSVTVHCDVDDINSTVHWPTAEPTNIPTAEPTSTSTAGPTSTPTAEPTSTPTAGPTSNIIEGAASALAARSDGTNNNRSPPSVRFVALPNGPGCGALTVSQSECQEAARSLGFSGTLNVGNWGSAPYGCHVGSQPGWRHTFWNSRGGQTGRRIYQSICYSQEYKDYLDANHDGTDDQYIALPNGPGCGGQTVPQSECQEAARALGFSGNFKVGSWGWAPYGCHVGSPPGWRHVFWNSQSGQTGRGIYQSICYSTAAGGSYGAVDPDSWTVMLTGKDVMILVLVAVNLVTIVAAYCLRSARRGYGTNKYRIVAVAESDEQSELESLS